MPKVFFTAEINEIFTGQIEKYAALGYDADMKKFLATSLLLSQLIQPLASANEFIWFEEYEQLNSTLNKHQGLQSSLESELHNLKNDRLLLKAKLSKLADELKELITHQKNITRDYLVSKISYTNFKDKLDLYEGLNKTSLEEVKVKQQEIETLFEQVEFYKEQYDLLGEQVTTRKEIFLSKLEKCRENTTECLKQTDVKAAQEYWINTSEKLSSVKEQLADITDIYHKTSQSLEKAKNTIAQYEAKKETLKTDLTKAEASFNELNSKKENLNQLTKANKEFTEKYKEELRTLDKIIVAKSQSLQSTNLKLANLRPEFDKSKRRYIDHMESITIATISNDKIEQVASSVSLDQASIVKEQEILELAKRYEVRKLMLEGIGLGIKEGRDSKELAAARKSISEQVIIESEVDKIWNNALSKQYLKNYAFSLAKGLTSVPKNMIDSIANYFVDKLQNSQKVSSQIASVKQKIIAQVKQMGQISELDKKSYIDRGVELSYIGKN